LHLPAMPMRAASSARLATRAFRPWSTPLPLAPDEGKTVADVFYRNPPHPQAPELKPNDEGWIWLPTNAFADAFAQHATAEEVA
jgi:hypothetical protein